MDFILDHLMQLHTPEGLVSIMRQGGLIVLIAIIFVETGLLAGFFLPGDSLLVTAGILSSSSSFGEPLFDPLTLAFALTVSAILGDQLNYTLGVKSGHWILSKAQANNRFIKKRYFDDAQAFYDKHGKMAIIIARFIPILRTFVPFMAGLAHMKRRDFSLYNIVGGFLWVNLLVGVGHFLGTTPLAQKLHHIILIVVIVSLIPLFVTVLKSLIKRTSS